MSVFDVDKAKALRSDLDRIFVIGVLIGITIVGGWCLSPSVGTAHLT